MGLLLASLFVLPAVAETPSAQEILNKSKQAMGGDAWDTVRTTYMKGKLVTSGLNGEGESSEDNLTGRYVDRFQLGPASGAEGFDGKQVWSQDSSGQPRPEGGDDARQGATDEAYRRCLAYWFPLRWSAEVEYSGEKEEQGKAFHVLRITPKGGRPFDLWTMRPPTCSITQWKRPPSKPARRIFPITESSAESKFPSPCVRRTATPSTTNS